MSKRIDVVAGVIYSKDKVQVLLARRKQDQHLAGFWEFPGGKIQNGESPETALKRELFEELDICISLYNPLMQITHDYQDKQVSIHFFEVMDWSGKTKGKEEQKIEWVMLENLKAYRMPEANHPVIHRLLLPEIALISEEKYDSEDRLINVLEDCIDNGLAYFQLRQNRISQSHLQLLIDKIDSLRRRKPFTFILNAEVNDVNDYPVDGIHLKARYLFDYQSRPINKQLILGASCHNKEEINQAVKLDADYIFLSPVMKTYSHPEQPAMGWETFSKLVKLSPSPVYALGGMQTPDLKVAKSHRARGIAMIRAIWESSAPGQSIRQCLND